MSVKDTVKKKFNQKVAHATKRETALGLLSLPYNSGLFKITRELINFAELMSLRAAIAQSADLEANPTVVLDSYDNPILIEDPQDFTEKLWQRYYEVNNEYLKDIKTIRATRKPEQI
jgi:chromosome condensin MukBEF MukE localization factor